MLVVEAVSAQRASKKRMGQNAGGGLFAASPSPSPKASVLGQP